MEGDKDYQFVTTQKGGRALVNIEYGFECYYLKESKKKMTFFCKNRTKSGCPAYAFILKSDMNAVWPDNHNHGLLHSATKVIEKKIIKDQSSSGDISTRNILQNITNAVANSSEASINLMSKKESLERRIRCSKHKAEVIHKVFLYHKYTILLL